MRKKQLGQTGVEVGVMSFGASFHPQVSVDGNLLDFCAARGMTPLPYSPPRCGTSEDVVANTATTAPGATTQADALRCMGNSFTSP